MQGPINSIGSPPEKSEALPEATIELTMLFANTDLAGIEATTTPAAVRVKNFLRVGFTVLLLILLVSISILFQPIIQIHMRR